MRLIARWGVAVAVSIAGFALAWWVCAKVIRLDEGVSLGIAGAVLAVLLAIAAWWAPRGTDSGGSDGGGGRRLVQKARAGGDVNMAGRDQTVINYRDRDE
jgi:high-affinity Fe2+/Pb2+ permease